MFLILIAGMKKNETTTMKIHCETEQTRQILRRKGVLVIILSASSICKTMIACPGSVTGCHT